MMVASDNRATLVQVTAAARIAPARVSFERLRTTRDGQPLAWPISMGVVIGPALGDPVAAFIGDHLSPGIMLEDLDEVPTDPGPAHQLTCVGNPVRTRTGDLVGVVYGKRGGHAPGLLGPQHVCVMPTRERDVVPEGEVVVQTYGRGLALAQIPQVVLMNMSPWLLDHLPLQRSSAGVRVDVTATVSSRQLGAGIGQDGWVGDVEIADPTCWDLRFGDLVAATDFQGLGRYPQAGFTSVGIVSHGPSGEPGHGVGLTMLMTGPSNVLTVGTANEPFGPFLSKAVLEV